MRNNSITRLLVWVLPWLAGGAAQAGTLLFEENFNGPLDREVWNISDGGIATYADYKDTYWQPGHATVKNGELTLRMDRFNDSGGSCQAGGCVDSDGHRKRFASAQIATWASFGANTRIDVRMRSPSGSGLVTGLFRTPGDSGDEMDYEFLGWTPNVVQSNYFRDGAGGHEVWHKAEEGSLPADFDFTQYHTYSLEATQNRLRWYIDDVLKREQDLAGSPFDQGHVMLELWTPTLEAMAQDPGWKAWAGDAFSGDSASVTVDRVAVRRLDSTSVSPVPLPPAVWLFGAGLAVLMVGGRVLPRRAPSSAAAT